MPIESLERNLCLLFFAFHWLCKTWRSTTFPCFSPAKQICWRGDPYQGGRDSHFVCMILRRGSSTCCTKGSENDRAFMPCRAPGTVRAAYKSACRNSFKSWRTPGHNQAGAESRTKLLKQDDRVGEDQTRPRAGPREAQAQDQHRRAGGTSRRVLMATPPAPSVSPLPFTITSLFPAHWLAEGHFQG